VPFSGGSCTIKNAHHRAKFIEHHLDGKRNETRLTFTDQLKLKLAQHETLEWVEIIFEKE
jgi:hypothetical protein